MIDNLHESLRPGVLYAPTVSSYDMSHDQSPRFDVEYETGCADSTGAFEFTTFKVTGDAGVGTAESNTLEEITAVFRLHCNGYPGTLQGCVHYRR